MFFINHREIEDSDNDDRSRMNLHEATFIVALSKYLIQQGYETTQVTILAMYRAQLMKINELLKQDPIVKEVHATTVDNFQGEENEIILVSFVRSNKQKVIGFLKTANRINVAFSRARKGLYCVGNFEYMVKKGGLMKEDSFPWRKLLENLRTQNAIGDAMEIFCQNHGTKSLVSNKADFTKKKCKLKCNTSLLCGHVCKRPCHIFKMDEEHLEMQQKCKTICNRKCVAGHPCPLACHYPEQCMCVVSVEKLRTECQHIVRAFCWENSSSIRCIEKVLVKSPCGHTVTVECFDARNTKKLLNACSKPCRVEPKCARRHRCPDKCHYPKSCGKCTVIVDKLRTECQHILQIPCHMDPSLVICSEPCKRNRSCGHKCKRVCSALCDAIFCNENVETKSPCGHFVTIKCSDATNDFKLLQKCHEPCNIELKCGHLCKGSCGRCFFGRLHIRYFSSVFPLWIFVSVILVISVAKKIAPKHCVVVIRAR